MSRERPWTEDDIDVLLNLFDMGFTKKEIANALGIQEWRVANKINWLIKQGVGMLRRNRT